MAAFSATVIPVQLRGLVRIAVLLSIALIGSPANAIVIRYEVFPLGRQTYRYVYTVENDGSLGSGTPVSLFSVSFDPSLYRESSLAQTTPPPLATGWNQLLLASAPGVPAAYDASALSGGVAGGAAASGFSVTFIWLGAGFPGAQPFAIHDPTTYALLDQGVTVDAPPTPWLLTTAVAALLAHRRMRSRRAPR